MNSVCVCAHTHTHTHICLVKKLRVYLVGCGTHWRFPRADQEESNLSVHKMNWKVDSKSQEIRQGNQKVRLWNGTLIPEV